MPFNLSHGAESPEYTYVLCHSNVSHFVVIYRKDWQHRELRCALLSLRYVYVCTYNVVALRRMNAAAALSIFTQSCIPIVVLCICTTFLFRTSGPRNALSRDFIITIPQTSIK